MTESGHPFQLFPDLDPATEAALRASIERFGVLVPVAVDQHGDILDGHHRIRIANELGVKYRTDVIHVTDDEQGREIARTLNADRRQLDPEQRRQVVAELRKQGHSQRAIAGALGVSHTTVQNDIASGGNYLPPERTIGKDGKTYPATRPKVEPIERFKIAQRVEERREEASRRASAELPLPVNGTYGVIYCDPPWAYEYAETPRRKIENHYPTMTHSQLLEMRVPAADDCMLFMWATSPKLAEAIEIMRAWGFEYLTCAVWVKDRIGMGYHFRQQHELLLLGRKGHVQPPLPEHRPPSVIQAPRTEHSAKPEAVYGYIERMYPGIPRIELFSRMKRDGWDSWGNDEAIS